MIVVIERVDFPQHGIVTSQHSVVFRRLWIGEEGIEGDTAGTVDRVPGAEEKPDHPPPLEFVSEPFVQSDNPERRILKTWSDTSIIVAATNGSPYLLDQ